MSQNPERSSKPASRTSGFGRLVRRFASDTSGATAIEYALIATLIGAALIVGAQTLGNSVNQLFVDTSSELTDSL